MTEDNKTYVTMAPTWEYAVTIHLGVLDNPNASQESKDNAVKEILRCARALDQMQQEAKEQENDDSTS